MEALNTIDINQKPEQIRRAGYGVFFKESIRKKRALLILPLLFLPYLSFSQSSQFYDSLKQAKEMVYSQHIQEAIPMLQELDKSYPADENIIQLYSQALYWNKDFDAVLAYYKKKSPLLPELEDLQLHFGRILFELNEFDVSRTLLENYLEQRPKDAEAGILLATIAYWQGNPPQVALDFLEEVLLYYPENPQAISLKNEIKMSTAPYLSISSSFYNDSQPLQALINTVEFSDYISAWLQPTVQFQNRNFKQADPTLFVQLANKSFIAKTNTEILMRVGLFKDSWHNDFSPTWGFDIRQKTFENIILSAGIDQRPYLFTLASLNKNLMPTSYSAGMSRQGEFWSANIHAQHMQFEDDNFVRTGIASLMFSVIKTPLLHLNIGYGFMMADADDNRFQLAEPFHATVSETEIGTNFPGIFNPYFTPQNQKAHSALAEMDVFISSKVSWNFNANIGVHATIDNPNVIFYGASNTQNPQNTPTTGEALIDPADIYSVLIPTEYFPMDLKSTLAWKINKNLNLKTEYAYQRAVFFESHMVSLGLNWKLTNE